MPSILLLFRSLHAATLMAQSSPSAETRCESSLSMMEQRGATYDMIKPSEGVPVNADGNKYSFDWIHKGRVGLGNKPGRYRWIMPWGFSISLPNNRRDTATVFIKNMKIMIFSRAGRYWRVLYESSNFRGRYFSRNIGKSEIISDLEFRKFYGSSTILDDRHVSHFWPVEPRRQINPADIGGVFVSMMARMNKGDYDKGARFAMNVGADYWISEHGSWDNYRTNQDVGIGRLKLVLPTWRTYYMTSAPRSILAYCVVSH